MMGNISETSKSKQNDGSAWSSACFHWAFYLQSLHIPSICSHMTASTYIHPQPIRCSPMTQEINGCVPSVTLWNTYQDILLILSMINHWELSFRPLFGSVLILTLACYILSLSLSLSPPSSSLSLSLHVCVSVYLFISAYVWVSATVALSSLSLSSPILSPSLCFCACMCLYDYLSSLSLSSFWTRPLPSASIAMTAASHALG